MTARQFCDWQTTGGANDVLQLVDLLEPADIALLVESHPRLRKTLPNNLKQQIQPPKEP